MILHLILTILKGLFLLLKILLLSLSQMESFMLFTELAMHPDCSVSDPITENFTETLPPSVPISSVTNSTSGAYKLKKTRPQCMSQRNMTGTRICYRCGDQSHMISECKA